MKVLTIVGLFLSLVSVAWAATAPNISGTAFDGTHVSLVGLRGKVVVVTFWAEWCGPCKAETPRLVSLHNSRRSRGFEVVAVNVDAPEDLQKAKDFIRQSGAKYQVIHDKTGSFSRNYGVAVLPTLFIVDKNGNIVLRKEGFSNPEFDSVVRKVDALL